MDNMKADDPVFEALFKQAVIDDYINEIDSIPSNEELAKKYSFSPQFDLRMKKLFARVRRKEIALKITKYSQKIAVVLLVISTVFFGVLLINPEVRAAVGNVVVEWLEKFTSITFTGDKENTEVKILSAEYLPNGYSQSLIEDLGNLTYIEFSDNMGNRIRFLYRPSGNIVSGISIDNENHIIENYMINGNFAFVATATDNDFENGIVFTVENHVAEVWGAIPVEELIKIAESVAVHKTD